MLAAYFRTLIFLSLVKMLFLAWELSLTLHRLLRSSFGDIGGWLQSPPVTALPRSLPLSLIGWALCISRAFIYTSTAVGVVCSAASSMPKNDRLQEWRSSYDESTPVMLRITQTHPLCYLGQCFVRPPLWHSADNQRPLHIWQRHRMEGKELWGYRA